MLGLFIDFIKLADSVGVIRLIACENGERGLAPVLPVHREPGFDVLEAGLAGEVEDYYAAVGIAKVRRNQASEPLLARRVPELQPDPLVFVAVVLGEEVDADCGLSFRWGT